jgi:hypothetical protein
MYGYRTEGMGDICFSGWCASRSQAYREAKAENPDAKIIYIGKWKEYIPDEFLFDVLGDIKREINFDMCRTGEYDATTEQEKELRALLQKTFIKWARKQGFKPMYIDGSTIVKYRLKEGTEQ